MSFPMDNRVFALAGLVQALQQVRRIADTGQSEMSSVRTAMDSVLRIDAESTLAVYGSASDIAPGLRLLHNHFRNQGRDESLPRLALAVLQLERRFVRDTATVEAVTSGIRRASQQAQVLGDSAHPEVIQILGTLYSETISTLRPRVMVQGNPHYLGQASVVAEIRALLMAAVRSAVLWRQMGGSMWDFLLSKRAMLEAIERALH